MNFIKKRNNPNYNFTWQERKVMRALWLKCAPMSYEQILGVCVSPLWHEKHGQSWIGMLLQKGVIEQLNTGEYDAVLDYYDYERYLKRRKLYTYFYPDPPYYPVTMYKGFDRDPEPEYTCRMLDKLLETRRKQLDSQESVSR